MNSENRSSFRTSVRTKDDLSKYSSYIANKAKLVAIMKSNESIKIKNSSFLHLHSMIESKPDDICESVNFSIITTITSTETKHVSKVYTEEKEEVYCKLLSYVKYFHIYDTIYTTKTEEEKALNEIPIANADLRKIIALSGHEWIDLIGYLLIQITEISYEEIKRQSMKSMQRYNKKLDFLFRLIKTFEFTLIQADNHKVDMSSYSIKRILKLLNVNIASFIPLLKITVVTSELKNKSLRKQRSLLYNKAYVLEMKKNIEDDENSSYVHMKQNNDMSRRMQTTSFEHIEKARDNASVFLHSLLEKIENKKKEINTIINNDKNLYVKVKYADDKFTFIYKKLYDFIVNDTSNEYDEYKVKDVKGNSITLSKGKLNEEKDFTPAYAKLNSGEYATKDDLNCLYDNFTFINQDSLLNVETEDEVKQKEPKLIDVVLVEQKEECMIEFENPEATDKLNKFKNDIITELNNDADKIHLIKCNNFFITENMIKKLKAKSDIDQEGVNREYVFMNVVDDKEMKLNKEDINKASIIDNDNKRYVKIGDSIVNKSEIIKAVNELDGIDKEIKVNQYKENEQIEEITIQPNSIHPFKYNNIDVPKQIYEINNELKEKINNVNENKALVLIDGKILRKELAEKIVNHQSEYDLYHIKDNKDNSIQISKNNIKTTLANSTVEKYIAINNIDDVTTIKYIPLSKLIENSNDDSTEIFTCKDIDGNEVSIPKEKIQIVVSNEDHSEKDNEILNHQPEQFKIDTLKEAQINVINVIDNNGKSHKIREDKLNLIISHKQDVPFTNYEIDSDDIISERIHLTKDNAEKGINTQQKKYFMGYNITNQNEKFFIDKDAFKQSENDFEEEYVIEDDKKIKFGDIRVYKLEPMNELPKQPEEEHFKLLFAKHKEIENDINNSQIYIKVIDTNNKEHFITEDTLAKLKILSTNDDNETFTIKCEKGEYTLPKNINANDSEHYIEINDTSINTNYIVNKSNILREIIKIKTDAPMELTDAITGNNISITSPHISLKKNTNKEEIVENKKKKEMIVEKKENTIINEPAPAVSRVKRVFSIRRVVEFRKKK